MSLTTQEKERYLRHLSLSAIGEQGQEKIKAGRVLVVGAGGLGSPILLYLTAAGVGQIGIIDNDTVSLSNLQRQILYNTEEQGYYKAEIAAKKLTDLNPACQIRPYSQRFTPENAEKTVAQYDIVVDATDNLLTRYLINDTCVKLGKPFVYGSICEFDGQVSVFNYQGGPTYRDLYPCPENVETFSQPQGVVGVLPGVIGSLQANEVLKMLIGLSEEVLSGKLLLVNLLENSFRTLTLPTSSQNKT